MPISMVSNVRIYIGNILSDFEVIDTILVLYYQLISGPRLLIWPILTLKTIGHIDTDTSMFNHGNKPSLNHLDSANFDIISGKDNFRAILSLEKLDFEHESICTI